MIHCQTVSRLKAIWYNHHLSILQLLTILVTQDVSSCVGPTVDPCVWCFAASPRGRGAGRTHARPGKE
jgi:hypothetical protein